MRYEVKLSRSYLGGREDRSIQLRNPFNELVPRQYRDKLLFGYPSNFEHLHRAHALEQLHTAESKIKFLDATGLRISGGAAKWPGYPFAPRGTDHIGEWFDPTVKGRRWFVLTSEPYKHRWSDCHSLIEWCAKNGWRREVATWPGIWSPPHTRLEVLAPIDYPRWDELMAAINGIDDKANWKGGFDVSTSNL